MLSVSQSSPVYDILSQTHRKFIGEFNASFYTDLPEEKRRFTLLKIKDLWCKSILQLPLRSFEFVLEQFQMMTQFTSKYQYPISDQFSLEQYKEMNVIVCELCELVVDVGIHFFNKISSEKESVNDKANKQARLLPFILDKTLEHSKANLYLAWMYINKWSDESMDVNDIQPLVKTCIQQSDDVIYRFINNFPACKSPIEMRILYHLEKMISVGHYISSKIDTYFKNYDNAVLHLESCVAFNTKYAGFIPTDPCGLLKIQGYDEVDESLTAMRSIKHAVDQLMPESTSENIVVKQKKKRKKKKVPIKLEAVESSLLNNVFDEVRDTLSIIVDQVVFKEELRMVPSPTQAPPVIDTKTTYNERVKEKKRVKKIEKLKALNIFKSTRLPVCYEKNSALKLLLDDISELFCASSCEGYLYGSANIKQSPGDFDIFIPNIIPDNKDKLNELLDRFVSKEHPILRDPKTGEYGYRKNNCHIISIVWKNFNLEFITSEQKNFVEHAMGTDFTVGVLYYNLRERSVYELQHLHSWNDFDQKILNTVIAPLESFYADPRRIFRGVRLIASEGYTFSTACLDAITSLFATENLFVTRLGFGALKYQLAKLFSSGFQQENLRVLHELGLLSNVLSALLPHSTQIVIEYRQRIQNFYSSLTPSIGSSVTFFSPQPHVSTANALSNHTSNCMASFPTEQVQVPSITHRK